MTNDVAHLFMCILIVFFFFLRTMYLNYCSKLKLHCLFIVELYKSSLYILELDSDQIHDLKYFKNFCLIQGQENLHLVSP